MAEHGPAVRGVEQAAFLGVDAGVGRTGLVLVLASGVEEDQLGVLPAGVYSLNFPAS